MEKWGIFALKSEVDEAKQLIESAGLEIFEVREVTMLEKIVYCPGMTDRTIDLWIVMFYATKDEYVALLETNDLAKVF